MKNELERRKKDLQRILFQTEEAEKDLDTYGVSTVEEAEAKLLKMDRQIDRLRRQKDEAWEKFIRDYPEFSEPED